MIIATFEQMVRERAYFLWIDSGRLDGMAHEHWVCAEQALFESIRPAKLAAADAVPVKKKRAAKPAGSTTAARGAAAKTASTVTKLARKAPAKAASRTTVSAITTH